MPFPPRGSVFSGPLLAPGVWLTLGALAGCEQHATEATARVDAPIVGGKLDTTHRGVVSLLRQVEGGFYPACSGTLLTQNLVLTAQHCVAALDSPDGSSIECGTTEFKAADRAASMLISVEANVGDDGLAPFRVSQVWVPAGGNAVCGRDIALLLLSGAGVPANQATPIEPNLTKELAANEVFAAVGFGLQDPGDETGETAGHRMGVANAKVFCEGTACGTDLVLEGEFIADAPVCSGDSGGPALDKSGQVSGVASRGDAKCTVGIYSSVSAWKEFIIEKTFTAASSGHYKPPTWAGDPPPGFDPGIPSGSSGSSSGGNGNGGTSAFPLAGGPSRPSGGGSSASGGTGSVVSPVIDPLGLTCSGECPGSYVCWAVDSQPPGICVPKCSAEQGSCPAEYECDTLLGACLRSADLHKKKVTHSGSCSVATLATSAQAQSQAWLGVLLLGALWGGRRARRQASGT